MTECSPLSSSKSQGKLVFLLREKRAAWSRVSAVLCFGVDALKQISELRQKKKTQQQPISSFCSLNLYIKCNVRSYQYSTCQCVSPVSSQRSPWRWCQHWMSSFVFYLNMKFFHRSAIFNFSRGQNGRCTNIYFSMFSPVCIAYRSCFVILLFYFFWFFLWGCSPATVAELRDDAKMWSGTHTYEEEEKRKKKGFNPCVFTLVSMTLDSCTD